MRYYGFIIAVIFFMIGLTSGLSAQTIAIKNNVVHDATATPNLGVEVGLGKRLSLDFYGGYHPWELSQKRSFKHWIIQPELRYWLFERFDGHFAGVHAQYMEYDIYGLNNIWGFEKENGYDGDLWGVGISYGYHWYLSPRWNIEFTLGGGFNKFEYQKYLKIEENLKEDIGRFSRNYYGITKLGISVVFILK